MTLASFSATLEIFSRRQKKISDKPHEREERVLNRFAKSGKCKKVSEASITTDSRFCEFFPSPTSYPTINPAPFLAETHTATHTANFVGSCLCVFAAKLNNDVLLGWFFFRRAGSSFCLSWISFSFALKKRSSSRRTPRPSGSQPATHTQKRSVSL